LRDNRYRTLMKITHGDRVLLAKLILCLPAVFDLESGGWNRSELWLVPQAALRDPSLYHFLALVDAIRDGGARERKITERDLVHRPRASYGQP